MKRTLSEKSFLTYNPSSSTGFSGDDLDQETDLEPSGPSNLTSKRRDYEDKDEELAPPGTSAFDAYFTHNAWPSRTSTSTFSQLVEPISSDEYAAAISWSSYSTPSQLLPEILLSEHKFAFPQYMRELNAGFNLLFYGLGSKRRVLNAFASSLLRRQGEVIVLNGYHPNFSAKDLIPALNRIPGVADLPIPSSGVEGYFQHVAHFLSSTTCKSQLNIVFHSMDASLRNAKIKAQLNILLSSANVRTIASIDHINAALLFSSSSLFASSPLSLSSQRSWIWHDLTTLDGYNTELAFTDKSSLRGASSRLQTEAPTTMKANGGPHITESAAQHVLLSVTTKAKKLFALLARHQLDADAEARTNEGLDSDKSMAYDQLFVIARDNFVATSDGALRALLGEFRDHGLIVTTSTGTLGTGEMLWVPMRKERLQRLVEWIQQQSVLL